MPETIVVEIELSTEESVKLDKLIEERCLDREKYLKRLLADSITRVLKKRDWALTIIAKQRGDPDRMPSQGT
jgi:hypothetical protein